MKRKIAVILIVAIIFIILIWQFRGLIKLYLPSSSKKAIIVAQNYVDENYQGSMKYLGVDTIFEPSGYWVYFTPKSFDLIFYVYVTAEFKIWGDIYHSRYFQYQLEAIFNGNIKELWTDEAYLLAIIGTGFVDLNKLGINETIDIEDENDYFDDYRFVIVTEKLLETDAKQEEAKKILEILLSIKSRGYEPYQVSFEYLESDSSDKNIYYEIKNWQDITNVEQVLKCLE